MNMKTEDKTLLDNYCLERNLSPGSKKAYISAIKQYTHFHQKTMVQLLEEAENEEEQGIRWKHRTLKTRLIQYRTYLMQNFNINTMRHYFTCITAIYTHYEIEIYKLPNVSYKQVKKPTPLLYDDIINKETLKKIFQISNPLMKAVLLHMISSGMAKSETIHLTIQDYFQSIQQYFNQPSSDDNIHDALYEIDLELNKMKNDYVIPVWKLRRQKTSTFYYTFTSPESLQYTTTYLLQRQDKLAMDKPLFKVNERHLNSIFQRLNDTLQLGKIGEFNTFRPHMLRKYHASNLCIGDNPLSKDNIDYLQGRVDTATHNSYFYQNIENLKKLYSDNMDQVMLFTEINTLNIDSPDVLELRKENERLRLENERIKHEIDSAVDDRINAVFKKYGVDDILRKHGLL